MPQFLPPNLLALFNPRDPIRYLPPVDKLTWEKRTDGYSGLGHLLNKFEDPKDTPPVVKGETKEQKLQRRRKEKEEQVLYKLEQQIALWDPNSNPDADSDPYRTLFVARLNYDTSESKLRREFEIYGPIKQIKLVQSKIDGKPRGYAFIEYEHERDMHSAYKHADGKKLDNRRILVDVERARTVEGWIPRRLGGGLGGTRNGGEDVNVKISGREMDRRRTDERLMREERERDTDRSRRDYDRRDRDRTRRVDDRDKRRRSRSRDRKRKRTPSPEAASRRRHRSRERNGEDPERRHRRDEDQDRKKERKRSRDRSRERKRREKEKARDPENGFKIKQEPSDDYPDYAQPPLLAENFPLKPEDQ